jgi:hypothetical protein
VKQALLAHPHTVGERGMTQSPDYADPERFALEP